MHNPAADRIIVVLHIGGQLQHAFIELRQQYGGQQIE